MLCFSACATYRMLKVTACMYVHRHSAPVPLTVTACSGTALSTVSARFMRRMSSAACSQRVGLNGSGYACCHWTVQHGRLCSDYLPKQLGGTIEHTVSVLWS
eukprot:GHRQ01034488.1.p2 GENE.GHRQ01034488.1~~GHRQ01034488.1.p2  ORF type:complete len:102 (-),score=8.63 GHRQ01034488.1:12-317(-)